MNNHNDPNSQTIANSVTFINNFSSEFRQVFCFIDSSTEKTHNNEYWEHYWKEILNYNFNSLWKHKTLIKSCD
jgi:hypothetical protein